MASTIRNNVYYHVEINKNAQGKDVSYEIVASSSKQRGESARTTLEKIERILKTNLSASARDTHSGKSRKEQIHRLNTVARVIYHQYESTADNRLWFLPASLYEKIITPTKNAWSTIKTQTQASLKSLPKPTVLNMLSFLGPQDLLSFAQVGRRENEDASSRKIERAKKHGYKGNDIAGATEYMRDLHKQLDALFALDIIPKKYQEYRGALWRRRVDRQHTLDNLREISTGDLFRVFCRAEMFKPSASNVRSLFATEGFCKAVRFPRPLSSGLIRLGMEALRCAIQHNDTPLAKLLLTRGANPNSFHGGQNVVHFAVHTKNIELLEYVLQSNSLNVDKNKRTTKGYTPLSGACIMGDKQVIRCLLDHGAGSGEERAKAELILKNE